MTGGERRPAHLHRRALAVRILDSSTARTVVNRDSTVVNQDSTVVVVDMVLPKALLRESTLLHILTR